MPRQPTSPATQPPIPSSARPLAPPPESKPLSPAELAAAEARERKKFEVLTIFATVYDHRVTELRWHVGDHEYRAWSNIEFNYLAGQGEIETPDRVYMLIMGIGNESAKALSLRKESPRGESFSDKRSEYFLANEAKEPPPPDALAPMDALHTFYDANRERLAEGYIQREAERAAHEQWQKEHPCRRTR